MSQMCKWWWLGKIPTAWLLGGWEPSLNQGKGTPQTTHSVTAVLAQWAPQKRRKSEGVRSGVHLLLSWVPAQSVCTLPCVWDTSEASLSLPGTWDEMAELSRVSHLLPTSLPAFGLIERWEHTDCVLNSSKRWWNWEERESLKNLGVEF